MTTIRIYKYRAEPASRADADALHTQLRLAGDYRRWLARIENGERAAIRALYREDPRIAWREGKLATALRYREASAGVRAAVWSRCIDRVAAELKTIRKEIRGTERYREAVVAMRALRGPMVRSARTHASAAGLFWGTYLGVEDAHSRAAIDVPPWESLKVHGSWNTVAVQIQSTAPMTGAAWRGGEDRRARLGTGRYPLGPRIEHFATVGAPGEKNRSGNVRPESWQQCQIRTGSDGRDPIWTSLHVLTGHGRGRGRNHPPPRLVPDDSQIKWVRVHRERVGLRDRWEVQVVASVPDVEPRAGAKTVGVDIGWRRVTGGIRIGYAVRSDQTTSELVIPDDVLTARDKADSLRSIRDLRSDQTRAWLSALRAAPDAPRWFVADTAAIHAWRRPGLLVGLLRKMQSDPAWPWSLVVVVLEEWRRKDAHLLAWEANTRRKLGHRILGRQRQWLADVLRDHDILGVESTIRIDRMRDRATADSEEARLAAVAHTESSPGMLRVLALQMAKARGMRPIEVPPAGTNRCPSCGAHEWVEPLATVVKVTCATCTTVSDQDHAAAIEIARRASDSVRDEGGEPLAPSGTTKRKAGRRNRKAVKMAPLAADHALAGDHG